jgi:hypothetical protein
VEPIFINFRTGDQDMAAPFLHRHLESRFGAGTAFWSKLIPPGADFSSELLRHAEGCMVMLALIGSGWLTIAGADGQPLLANPDDWVRREIAIALTAGRRVVPVMLGNTRRLGEEDSLPADISALRRAEYRQLRRSSVEEDLAALCEGLMTVIPGLRAEDLAPPSRGGTASVSVNCGDVAGVRIGRTRASARDLRDLGANFTVNVGYQGPGGAASVMDIGEWDDIEEWGNAAAGSGGPVPST